jgi:Protein of unknown function (DUF4236)
MPFTFRKSVKIFPGVRLNLNKNSVSITLRLGPFHKTWSTTGRRTTSVDLPGPVNYRRTRTRRDR